MPSCEIRSNHVRRLLRRLTVFVLVASLGTLVLVAVFSAWVVAITVPVMVVDGDGNPLADVKVFDWDGAIGQPPPPIVPAPGASSLSTSPAPNPSPIHSSPTGVRARLHRWVQPFGVALTWDWARPVSTGGSGTARVPRSPYVTAISLGDRKAEPGQVFVVEGTAAQKTGLVPQAKIVVRPLHTPAGLAKRVNRWKYVEVPLGAFLNDVRNETGLRLDIDLTALEDEGVTLGTPVSIDVGDVPIESAMKFFLGEFNLTFLARSGSILITSQLRAAGALETRLYVVSDLLSSEGEAIERDAEELQDLIQSVVSPNSWTSVGGAAGLIVSPADRTLVVSNLAACHGQIATFLESLRRGKDAPPSADEERLWRTLDRRVSLNFKETPLGNVIDQIKKLVSTQNIVLDRMYLEVEGVASDTPVTLRVNDMPLRDALRFLLQYLNLTFVIQGDMLVITSQLMACNELRHRIYSVADLLGSPPDRDSLIRIIEQVVSHPPGFAGNVGKEVSPFAPRKGASFRGAKGDFLGSPNTWATVGGPCTIQPFSSRGLFIINHTEAVHEQIGLLLDALRTGCQYFETTEDRRFNEAMKASISFDFHDTPLDEAVRFLAARAGIENVYFHRQYLEDEGVQPGSPVTLRGRRMSIRSALRNVLRPLDLTSFVRYGTLSVTSELQSDNELVHRLYPVADLIGDPPDPDSLSDLIENTIAQVSWDTVGGPGSFVYFPLKRYLFIFNTEAVHAAIDDLLIQLRGQPKPVEPIEEAIRRLLGTIYDWRFDRGTLDQLADRLAAGLDSTVIVDWAALGEAAISTSDVVAVTARTEPLATALARDLEQIGAGYFVHHEALVITSRDDVVSNRIFPSVYSVRSLVRSVDTGKQLAEMIQREVLPDEWSDSGGIGTVIYFPHTSHLVVCHTGRVRAEVEQFLTKLARGRDDYTR